MLKPAVWTLVDVQVHGRERLKDLADPYIVVSNHSSHLDCPLIIGSLPRRLSKHLATGAAADYFFESWWRRAPTSLFFNAFPVERGFSQRQRGERGSRARGMSGHLLNDGVPLLLFPEGTRSRTKAMGNFTPGVAALCISRNVPCLPVAIVGAALAMPRGNTLPSWGRRPVHVVFGDPMWAEPGETARHFSDRIAAHIRELHDTTALAVGLPRMNDYEQAALANCTAEGEPIPGDADDRHGNDNGMEQR
ncbi:1-acyl-sn-glycerol-3-phosphate acyltransferase [Enemella dayhoffiae]|uniref:1-acyl-sn-glycerol-3-phosphate acyltransferase n=2 Tax=Enemella dayhoffiae TaxID=2016507 RepID=A0A255GM88_9ACTN|nr:1-acyl-sn-glycerol-3-phosphate acyltransferase [Enemella dayhoffiae]